ncbi:hypothetical protein ABGB12_02750 [Actinocorallia sp. B10E7]|uniref:hypothetical protein n=1 Tax=Actinocorallia sp. B10E7 TaxID=3153558 RepID=UPI00325E1DD5
MPDLDRLFDDLCSDLASGASGPPAERIARLGGARRNRRRALGAGTAAVIALGGVLFLGSPRDEHAGPAVRPTATASAQPRLELSDLVYWPKAQRQGAEGWSISEDAPHLGNILPGCPDREIKAQGWVRHLGLEFTGDPLGDFFLSGPQEIVVVFSDPARATAWFDALHTNTKACHEAPSKVDVGDDGYRIEAEEEPEEPNRPFHVTNAVVFRQGPVVAIYMREKARDLGQMPELGDLEKDARALSDHLCERGFGC